MGGRVFMSGKGMVGPVSPEVSRKLANLGLLCAWLVVAWHCAVDGHGAAEGGPAWWASRFFLGCWVRFSVPFFFVASGYFLCGHCDERGRPPSGRRWRPCRATWLKSRPWWRCARSGRCCCGDGSRGWPRCFSAGARRSCQNVGHPDCVDAPPRCPS